MNARSEGSSQGGFRLRTVVVVIAIAVMSFGALLTLMAWGPELQNTSRAGAHAYSNSALGYAGLVKLIEARGRSVSISRTPQMLDAHDGLVILAPGIAASKLEDQLPLYGPALIILPKWYGRTDRRKPQWQEDISLQNTYRAESVLGHFDEDASIRHVTPSGTVSIGSRKFLAKFEEKMQIIKSKQLEIVIAAPGGALLTKLADDDVYILSDPDLANNFGLAEPENARLMLTIIDLVETNGSDGVVFDATLNGFERSTNLLRILLDIPFLGATLTILMGFLLLGWSACIRFGTPAREAPAFALGKQALADNTAGLITMTRREARMAPGYLALSRKAIAKSLSTPANLSEAEFRALLDRLGPDEASGQSWSQLEQALKAPVKTREDLLNKTQRLYRWRKEKTHGHK